MGRAGCLLSTIAGELLGEQRLKFWVFQPASGVGREAHFGTNRKILATGKQAGGSDGIQRGNVGVLMSTSTQILLSSDLYPLCL